MQVSLLHKDAVVAVLGSMTSFVFDLKSAWIAASLNKEALFMGGFPITIRGKGFNPALPSGYTCQLLESRCLHASDTSECVIVDSSHIHLMYT